MWVHFVEILLLGNTAEPLAPAVKDAPSAYTELDPQDGNISKATDDIPLSTLLPDSREVFIEKLHKRRHADRNLPEAEMSNECSTFCQYILVWYTYDMRYKAPKVFHLDMTFLVTKRHLVTQMISKHWLTSKSPKTSTVPWPLNNNQWKLAFGLNSAIVFMTIIKLTLKKCPYRTIYEHQ